MAFNAEGYRQAAMKAGIPKDVIEQSIAERSGVKGWLTGGKKGLGGFLTGVGNVLNLPSYAIGGLLNRTQQAGQSKYAQGQKQGLGILQGIKEKRGVMTELPETLGIDPTSTTGRVIGFGGELLTPDILGAGFDLFRAGKTASSAGDVGLFNKAGQRAGTKLSEASEDIITKGIGNPATLRKVEQITKEKPGALIKRLGLESRDVEQARDLKKTLLKQFNELGLSSKAKTSIKPTIKAFDDEILKMNELKALGSENAGVVAKELFKRKELFLKQAKQADELGVDVFTQLKRAAAQDVPSTQIGLGPIGSGKASAAEFARKQFQEGAIRGEPGLRQLGTDLRALGGSPKSKGLIDVFESSAARGSARSPIGLRGIATTGIGGAIKGIPGAVAGMAFDMALSSPRVLKATSNVLETGSRVAPKVGSTIQKASPLMRRAGTTLFRTMAAPNQATPKQSQSIKQSRITTPSYKSNIQPRLNTVKQAPLPTAESFYDEIRKKRGY